VNRINHNSGDNIQYDVPEGDGTGEGEISSIRINLQQLIKWTVYVLLLFNWALYFQEDWQNAQHTLRNGGSLLDWSTAFGTTFDEAAWFGLLILWELETYALSDDALSRPVQWTFIGIRTACYIFLAHTVFAWGVAFMDLQQLEADPDITSLCQLAGQEVSFAYNQHYTLIDTQNCEQLSSDSVFFFVDPSAVTDAAGFVVERRSAWIDLQDAITWLLIMFSIELGIWLQERNITGGPLMLLSHAGKFFYAVLFVEAAYWAWMGHWLWAWDQTLWICGFWAIEYNMKEWREEIEHDEAEHAQGLKIHEH
jgi:hypothetical protein